MNKFPTIIFVLLFLIGCNTKQEQARQAQALIDRAAELVICGKNNAAKLRLDSVHSLYPKCINQRRAAQSLMDSIVYIEAIQTLNYSDSLLQILLPQVDSILKNFNNEKQSDYENVGRYVHKLLPTNRNIARCFLQAYVSEDFHTILKSYYYGTTIRHQQVALSANDNQITISGTTHSFNDENSTYEILTANEDEALFALQFIANNADERIKVTLHGEQDYIYYLNSNEKKALLQTYQLAILMNDIHRLEQQINQSNAKILKYQHKH